MGEWITGSGGATMAGTPSPANGGAFNALAQQSKAPQDFEVSHEPSPPLTGASLESSHAPLPAASSAPQQRQEPSMLVTGILPESSAMLPRSASEAPAQQQQPLQWQPRASPAVIRSVSWQRGGTGPAA